MKMRVATLVLLLAACGSAPKEQFYTLGDGAAVASGSLPNLDYGVLVGPVSVPELVDRPQFVLRMTGSEVRITEQVRWAEPLRQAIPRVLAANLAQDLNNARVTPQAAGGTADPDYRVVLDVQRFDSALAQGAGLEVVWTVRRTKTGEQQTGRANLYEAASGAGYQELIAAHQRAIASLSRSVGEAIHSLRDRDAAAVAVQPAAMTGTR
jgi:uncharacterized lipoprotein YmbA